MVLSATDRSMKTPRRCGAFSCTDHRWIDRAPIPEVTERCGSCCVRALFGVVLPTRIRIRSRSLPSPVQRTTPLKWVSPSTGPGPCPRSCGEVRCERLAGSEEVPETRNRRGCRTASIHAGPGRGRRSFLQTGADAGAKGRELNGLAPPTGPRTRKATGATEYDTGAGRSLMDRERSAPKWTAPARVLKIRSKAGLACALAWAHGADRPRPALHSVRLPGRTDRGMTIAGRPWIFLNSRVTEVPVGSSSGGAPVPCPLRHPPFSGLSPAEDVDRTRTPQEGCLEKLCTFLT